MALYLIEVQTLAVRTEWPQRQAIYWSTVISAEVHTAGPKTLAVPLYLAMNSSTDLYV